MPAGETVQLTVLERGELERLRRLFDRLSPETRYRRFLGAVVRFDQTRPERLLDIDHRDREAVTARVGDEIIGVARYARLDPGASAEIAVVVEDAWHRRGVGTHMMRWLRSLASDADIKTFTGVMHADNRPVIGLLRKVFPNASFHLEGRYLEVEIGLV